MITIGLERNQVNGNAISREYISRKQTICTMYITLYLLKGKYHIPRHITIYLHLIRYSGKGNNDKHKRKLKSCKKQILVQCPP